MVVDSLRPDFLDVYNSSKSLTPNINNISESGTTFQYAFSQSNWTYLSLYSLLTGLYPSRLDLSFFHQRIKAPNRLLPELLKRKNFHTAVFSSFKSLVNPKTFGSHFSERRLIKATDSSVFELQKWIKSFGSQKDVFLLYHLGEYTHVPYCAPDKFISKKVNRKIILNKNIQILTKKFSDEGKIREVLRQINARLMKLKPEELQYLRECYSGGVRYIDHFIGKCYEVLYGQDPDLVFILVADHGEGFLEHRIIGHGLGVYNELIRIPMIITGNGFVKQKVKYPVQLLDLYPTICSITGIDKVNSKVDGMRLSDRIQGKSSKVLCDAYPLIALIDGRYKLMSSHLKFKSLKQVLMETKILASKKKWGRMLYTLHSYLKKDELYDYFKDPKEKNNIRKENSKIYEKLRKELKNYISHRKDVFLTHKDINLDDEMIKQLKGLGYM